MKKTMEEIKELRNSDKWKSTYERMITDKSLFRSSKSFLKYIDILSEMPEVDQRNPMSSFKWFKKAMEEARKEDE